MAVVRVVVADMAKSLRQAPALIMDFSADSKIHRRPRYRFLNKNFSSPGGMNTFRNFAARASETCNNENLQLRIAPLQFETPTGQLLSQVMQTNPHRLPELVSQQLSILQEEKDAENNDKSLGPMDLLRREKKRKEVLEEVIYCGVVHKFMENNISMIPPIPNPIDILEPVDSWPNQEQKYRSIHSSDALGTVKIFLSRFSGGKRKSESSEYCTSTMAKLHFGRIDQNFQLQKMKKKKSDRDDPLTVVNDLQTYIIVMDDETNLRIRVPRSKEAISLIEKQTEAVFGKLSYQRVVDDGTLDVTVDQVIGLTFTGKRMLILEGIAFGSFLWDVEGCVESNHKLLSR